MFKITYVACLLIALTLGAATALSPKSVFAAPCTSAPGPYSTNPGYNYKSIITKPAYTTVGGVYGQIQRYDNAYMNTRTRNEVVDYVMLKDGSVTWKYAQMGFSYSHSMGLGGVSAEVWAEVMINAQGGFGDYYGPASSAGYYPVFTILYNYVPNRFTFQLNSNQWIPNGYSNGWNPTAYFTPNASEVGGETTYGDDQMPGDRLQHVGHWGAHTYIGGSWGFMYGTTFSTNYARYGIDPPPGNQAYTNGGQFYIWDQNCA